MKSQSSPAAGWFYTVAIAVFLLIIYQAFGAGFHARYVLALSSLAVILSGIRLGQLMAGLRGAVLGGLGMLLLLFCFLVLLNGARETHRLAMHLQETSFSLSVSIPFICG